MARPDSFYLPPKKWAEPYVLDGPEARHLSQVLRASPGTMVRLFDGLGREGEFRVEAVGKRFVDLEPVDVRTVPEPRLAASLALGWNKSSRREMFLEKAVELMAGSIAFWRSERSQGSPPREPKPKWTDALLRGAKQCGAARLPVLEVLPGGLDHLIRFAQLYDKWYVCWEFSGPGKVLEPAMIPEAGKVLFVVGPEGGFTPQEVDSLAAAGGLVVGLGQSVLRWETAALLCLGTAYLRGQAAG